MSHTPKLAFQGMHGWLHACIIRVPGVSATFQSNEVLCPCSATSWLVHVVRLCTLQLRQLHLLSLSGQPRMEMIE